MNRLTSTLPFALLASLALTGFGPGGCGGITDPCAGLDEKACLADGRCAAEYGPVPAIACMPCAPDAPNCTGCVLPKPSFNGCREKPAVACRELNEQACLSHPECRAVYAETTTDPATGARCGNSNFVGCENRVCPAVMCAPGCRLSVGVDGCQTCACDPIDPAGCTKDADCAADERCVIPEIDCPPGAACAMPLGRCEKQPAACTTDADCRAGQRCEFLAVCMAIGCPPPPTTGTCVDVQCSSDADCSLDSTCEPVATPPPCDPATGPCPMLMPARLICQPLCLALDLQSCSARSDCQAIRYPCDPGPDGSYTDCFECRPACPEVMCDLYCPGGKMATDHNGCELCACETAQCGGRTCAAGERCVSNQCLPPGACLSDADCDGGSCLWLMACAVDQPGCYGKCEPARCSAERPCPAGQVCNADGACVASGQCRVTADCAAGETCLQGTCRPEGSCLSDSDCRSGGTCIVLMDCATGPNCYGTCNYPPPGTCSSDEQCAPGEICMIHCGTPPVSGYCQDARCSSDADCRAGMQCLPDPKDPCSKPDVQCFAPAVTICQMPCSSATTEEDCRARPNCKAVYGQYCDAAGNCTPDMTFKRCE